MSSIQIIPHNLKSYDSLLENDEVDFIGTRLHAGIRAIQFKQRSIIIGIDNRALEMGKDFNIPVLKRLELDELHKLIQADLEVDISIPLENINKWKSQFA